MTRGRWANGNQVTYSGSQWYRFVMDADSSATGITVWWGVESSTSLSDSNNTAETVVDGNSTSHNNVSYSHGGAAVTWIRSDTFAVNRGSTISISGSVRALADQAGGGGTSTAANSWTNPALPPNQMAAPIVNNIAATTHQTHFAWPGTNGSDVTSYYYEYHYADSPPVPFVTDGLAYSTPIYATGFEPNRPYAVRMAANSAAGRSPISAWTYFTQAVAAPIAPSTPVVTRNSDVSHSLVWTRASPTQGPYASQEVLRQQLVNGAWGPASAIATLSSTATTYVDTTTVANKAYLYGVRATNASGTANSAGGSTVWTTPGVPTNPSAAKDASSNIVVTWAAPASAPRASDLKYEVSDSTDGGTVWTVLNTTATGVVTYTHTSPNAALPHLYRIRAIIGTTGDVGSGLASAYVSTNTVQLLTPPLAPVNLQNTPAGTVDRAQAVVLTWTHNPVDSSSQTKYTLQHRRLGTTPWTTVGPTTTAVSSYTLPANTYTTGTAFEWQVMTWGLHATGSPYSAVATTQISSTPGVSISSPTAGAVVTSTTLTASWTFSDPDGDAQGSWEATLYAASGETLETRSGADTATTTTFAYRLADAGSYSVKVRVRDSRGLWSSLDTKNFTVTYPLPPTPVVTGTLWDWKKGTVELNLSVPAPTGTQVAPVYLEVWRSIDDGPYQRLVTNLPPATVSFLDTTPTVDGKNTYVVVAVSALPSVAQSDPLASSATVLTPQAADGRPGIWLSGGPGFTKLGRLATEVTVDAGRVRERVLQRYAGRPLPVEHSGEHVSETWQISGNLNLRWSQDIDAPDSPEGWLALGSLAGPFLLRAPALFGGQPIYAFVSIEGPNVSRKTGGNVQQVSFTATRTEY